MSYFFDTTETVPNDVGFAQMGALHLVWLVICLVVVVSSCIWYRKMQETGRGGWKKSVALLLIADELFKVAMLIIGGRYNASYLPLHLCSINIFVIAIHAWRPSKILDNFLFTVCIPGAAAALIFPSWTSLPLGNFMHIHSFTIHILLMLYPVVLSVSGELRPDVKQVPKSILLLVVMAALIYGINLLLDTNFMFLMQADPGNPLYLFEQMWGNHLLGFPVVIVGVLLVMYGPVVLFRKLHKKEL